MNNINKERTIIQNNNSSVILVSNNSPRQVDPAIKPRGLISQVLKCSYLVATQIKIEKNIFQYFVGSEENQYHNTDLFALACCNKDTYAIFLKYLETLADAYFNDPTLFPSKFLAFNNADNESITSEIDKPNCILNFKCVNSAKIKEHKPHNTDLATLPSYKNATDAAFLRDISEFIGIENSSYSNTLELLNLNNIYTENLEIENERIDIINEVLNYLNTADLNDNQIEDTLAQVIKYQKDSLPTKRSNQLLEAILINLSDTLAETNEPWEKKARALNLIRKLAEYHCLNQKIKIFIQIITAQAEALLNHSQSQLSYAALLTISNLSKIKLIESITIKMIKAVLLYIEGLFAHNDLNPNYEVIMQILDLLKRPESARLLLKVELHIIESIVNQAIKLLDSEEKHRHLTPLFIINIFIETKQLMNKVEPIVISYIFFQLNNLLNHEDAKVLAFTLMAINHLAKANLLDEIDSNSIEDIVKNAESLLNHKHKEIIQCTLLMIYQFLQTQLITIEFAQTILFEMKPELIANMLLDLCNHHTILATRHLIALLDKTDLLTRMRFTTLQKISSQAEKLLPHNQAPISGSALCIMAAISQSIQKFNQHWYDPTFIAQLDQTMKELNQ